VTEAGYGEEAVSGPVIVMATQKIDVARFVYACEAYSAKMARERKLWLRA